MLCNLKSVAEKGFGITKYVPPSHWNKSFVKDVSSLIQ